MKKFTDFYEAWWYLVEHGAFISKPLYEDTKHIDGGAVESSDFQYLLNIDVQKVNPATHKIDDDESKNTKTEVWLEFGPWYEETDENIQKTLGSKWVHFHDVRLDCGADTFEEAIIELANLVEEYYPLEEYGTIGHLHIERL